MIYGHTGVPFLSFPTQNSMCRNYEDFGMIDQLADFIEGGRIQLFVVDTVDAESFIQCACRFTENCTLCDNGGGGSKRQEVKQLLKRLGRDNPKVAQNVFNSIHVLQMDTMPGWKQNGVEHTFLEWYDSTGEGDIR